MLQQSKRNLTILTLLIATFLTVAAQSAETAPKKLRVLFIGNSLTSVNNLPAMIAAMASASGHELDFFPSLIGGATLQKHWDEGNALPKIKEGGWDYVVLQDLSREAYKDRDSMFRHARLFDAEIRKTGARTIFYMTWALEDAQDKFTAIADAYTTLGKELHARVVPVGVAWHKVTESGKPSFQLYLPDHKHPSPSGTYLAACLFYRALFETPSSGLPNRIESKGNVLADLSKEDAAALQKIADATPPSPIE